MKVDMRTFDKQKRQHNLLISDLTMIHQPPFSGSSGQSRCSGRVSSASMISTMSEVFVNKSHSTDFSKQMNPTAEVIHKRITLHHVLRTGGTGGTLPNISDYLGEPGLQTRGKANEHHCHLNQRDCPSPQHWLTPGCHKLS